MTILAACSFSETLEQILKILGGGLTPVIAISTVIIAYRQYRTSSDNLRLALFDRRYKVYRGVMDFLGSVVTDFSVKHEDLGKFYSETDQKRFVFGRDIQEYLKEIREKAVELRRINGRLSLDETSTDEVIGPLIESAGELEAWFANQVEEAQKRFEPYLGFYHKL